MLKLFRNLRRSFVASKIKMLSSANHSDMIFAQKFNPISGKIEWEPQDENFDYHQEIARSAYADMLHDTERNKLYEAGLRWGINKLRCEGKPVRVLDIGTGTGLLAMFACRLGADKVTACEAFQPVASCARKIMTENGFGDKINLISKRSTELRVGPGCDMDERATILVTEVFDTELIGEGAISTFNHAHEYLLEQGCLVIPSRATVYCQIVDSKLLRRCHQHFPVKLEGYEDIIPPSETMECRGSAAVLDLQMSQLPEHSYKLLSEPFKVASFDFTGVSGKIPDDEMTRSTVTANNSGSSDALLFWWDIEMDGIGDVILSCASWWNHPEGKNQSWRDHWMQAVYFPISSVEVEKGDNVVVSCYHDQYSFWFDIKLSEEHLPTIQFGRRPACTCGLHLVCNPQRMALLNDSTINSYYFSILKSVINSETVCLFVGDGCSLLPLLAARLNAKKVYVIDGSRLSSQILSRYVEVNGLKSKVKILTKSCECISSEDLEGDKIDVVMSEPYFLSNYLPWHDIALWYLLGNMKDFMKADCYVTPSKCRLWAVGMSFDHLWKIRAPLGNVEGFDMTSFDQLVQNSSNVADSPVEPQPLWEYEGVALTEPIELFELHYRNLVDDEATAVHSVRSVPFKSSGLCNAVAIWAEWWFDNEIKIVRGPTQPVICGEKVHWDFNSKQGVYFVSPEHVSTDSILSYDIQFQPKTFAHSFHFYVNV
ncbi:Protein arginine n-methyltransferase [Chamberlinius hualienensis]